MKLVNFQLNINEPYDYSTYGNNKKYILLIEVLFLQLNIYV